jgi:hypothetical protein
MERRPEIRIAFVTESDEKHDALPEQRTEQEKRIPRERNG